MRLKQAKAPFVKKPATVSSMMWDTVLALAFLLLLPVYYYGLRPLILAGLSAGTAILCEIVFHLFQGKRNLIADPSGLVTGLVVVLLLPVNAPVWLPCVGSAFAMLAAKLPFGGTGRNPFNPAAAGVAFCIVCWPALAFSYVDASAGALPLFADCTVPAGSSAAGILKQGFQPEPMPLDLLWGTAAGPMGCTATLVLGASFLYLLLRRTAHAQATLCFLAVAGLIAYFSPRVVCGPITSLKYELLSGSLLFGAVFLASDPATSARTPLGRCLFGAFAGVLTMLLRYFGAYEQGVCFAILLANAASPLLDRVVCGIRFQKGVIA